MSAYIEQSDRAKLEMKQAQQGRRYEVTAGWDIFYSVRGELITKKSLLKGRGATKFWLIESSPFLHHIDRDAIRKVVYLPPTYF